MKSQLILLLGLTILVSAFAQSPVIEPVERDEQRHVEKENAHEKPIYEPFTTEDI